MYLDAQHGLQCTAQQRRTSCRSKRKCTWCPCSGNWEERDEGVFVPSHIVEGAPMTFEWHGRTTVSAYLPSAKHESTWHVSRLVWCGVFFIIKDTIAYQRAVRQCAEKYACCSVFMCALAQTLFQIRERECTGLPIWRLGKLFFLPEPYFWWRASIGPILPTTPILPLAAGSLWMCGSRKYCFLVDESALDAFFFFWQAEWDVRMKQGSTQDLTFKSQVDDWQNTTAGEKQINKKHRRNTTKMLKNHSNHAHQSPDWTMYLLSGWTHDKYDEHLTKCEEQKRNHKHVRIWLLE